MTAEDDWWGTRCLTPPISTEGDPVENIFQTYYSGTLSPRRLSGPGRDGWFDAAAGAVDGVVFYLPPEDDVIGWDYPRLSQSLDSRGIPHLLIRACARTLNQEIETRIAAFVSGLGRGR